MPYKPLRCAVQKSHHSLSLYKPLDFSGELFAVICRLFLVPVGGTHSDLS